VGRGPEQPGGSTPLGIPNDETACPRVGPPVGLALGAGGVALPLTERRAERRRFRKMWCQAVSTNRIFVAPQTLDASNRQLHDELSSPPADTDVGASFWMGSRQILTVRYVLAGGVIAHATTRCRHAPPDDMAPAPNPLFGLSPPVSSWMPRRGAIPETKEPLPSRRGQDFARQASTPNCPGPFFAVQQILRFYQSRGRPVTTDAASRAALISTLRGS
jgi:hypothetical protein